MTLDQYARLVTQEVRRKLPDVSATQSPTTVRWRRGSAIATLDATDRTTWWLRAGALTYTERFDAAAARVTAENLIAHFE